MSTVEPQSPAPMILEAGRTARQYWHDVWRYRELFFILAWRGVSVRYKQTMLGVAWAFMRSVSIIGPMRLTSPIDFKPRPGGQGE